MQKPHLTRDRWRFLRTSASSTVLIITMAAILPAPTLAQSDPDSAGAVIATPPMDEVVAQTTAEIASGIKADLTESLANISRIKADLSTCLNDAARVGTAGGPQTSLGPNQLTLVCATDYRLGKTAVLQDSQEIFFTIAELAAKEGERVGALIGEAQLQRAAFDTRAMRAREGAQVLFDANRKILAKDPTTLTLDEAEALAAIQRQITMTLQEEKAAGVAMAKFDGAIKRMDGLATYLDDWSRSSRGRGLDLDVTIHGERLALETLAIDTEMSAIWEGPSAMPSLLSDLGASLTGLDGFKDDDPAGLGQTTGGTEMSARDLPPVPSDDPAARQAALMGAFEQLGVLVPEEMKSKAAPAPVVVDEGLGQ
jgi:hypothetical protein